MYFEKGASSVTADPPGQSAVMAAVPDARWAGRGFGAAMRSTMLLPWAFLQPVFVVAVLTSALRTSSLVPLVVHIAVLASVIVVVRLHGSPLWIVSMLCASVVLDFAAVESPTSPLAVLSIGLAPLITMLPIMLSPGWVPICASVGIGAVIIATVRIQHPEWNVAFGNALGISTICVAAGAFLLIRRLRAFTAAVDRQEWESFSEAQRSAQLEARLETSAERSRMLHDTIINTFGALARDQAVAYDASLVRERCEQDIERILAFRRLQDPTSTLSRLRDVQPAGLLPANWSGSDRELLRAAEARLPAAVLQALHDCALEAWRNATKHSGADTVQIITAEDADGFDVTVSDTGRGFDPDVALRGAGGLAESVVARARAQCIDVTLHTTPGGGTSVRFRYRYVRAGAGTAQHASPVHGAVARRLLRTDCFTWVLVTLIACFIAETFINAGGVTLSHGSLALMGAISAAAAWATRRGTHLPGALVVVILGAIPVTAFGILAAADFGTQGQHRFQPLSLAPLLIILLACSRGRKPFIVGASLLVASCAAALVIASTTHPEMLVSAVLMLAPVLAVIATWSLHRRQLLALINRAGIAWAAMKEERRRQAVLQASASVRASWNDDRIEESLGLLRDLAAGTSSIGSSSVRHRLVALEQDLRDLIAQPLTAGPFDPWLQRARSAARTQGTRLMVHPGQLPDAGTRQAAAFGALLLACIDHASGSTAVRVSFLRFDGCLRMVVSGDAGLHVPHEKLTSHPDLHVDVEDVDGRVLIQATWRAVEAVEHRTER